VNRKKSPYARIMRAAFKGVGLKLTADEVLDLSRDHAIETRGRADLEDVDCLETEGLCTYCRFPLGSSSCQHSHP
jgi:hypothetical protein